MIILTISLKGKVGIQLCTPTETLVHAPTVFR